MKISVIIALTMAAIAVTGCATTEAGTAVPAPDPPSNGSTEAGPAAPTVADPLDASKYVADPCAVLTPAQLASYGVIRTKPGAPSSSSDFSQPSCLWYGSAQSINLSVSWLTSNKNGLADTYDIQYGGSETWDYFEETEVEEYPGVFNYFSEDPEHGNCHVTVGISERLVYTVSIQGQGNIDAQTSCDRVEEAAEAVIHTLKENQ